jgi:hypothetical protein
VAHFLDSLDEVLADQPCLGDGDTENEARTNLWSFSATRREIAALRESDVSSFLEKIIARRDQQVAARHGRSRQALFYCWFDEPAVQLRFSLISQYSGRLPFCCPIDRVDTPDRIIASFLGSPYHDGIPLDGQPLPGADRPASEQADIPLPVWVRLLPTADGKAGG